MSELTKRAIQESFKKLLSNQPLDKITVKNITDDCGVNRNTFYYHYSDIYQLLEEIFLTEAQKSVEKMEVGQSWEEGLKTGLCFVKENKKLIYHVYSSLHRETIERYLYSVSLDFASRDWISKVYVSEALSGDAELMAQVEKLPYEIVTDSVFRQMSDTQTPQGIMTVLKKPSYIMEDILGGKNPLVMILEDLQDPGNAGTILRTGEGAGVSGVLLTKTCVDITNPKVIRSTMGSVYRMPFLYVESVVSLAQELKDRNIRTFAAHLHGKNSYDQESYTGGTAFLIGNEGKGLTDEAADSADCLIRIPMCGKVESLNAAMASGILMYEAARQRR